MSHEESRARIKLWIMALVLNIRLRSAVMNKLTKSFAQAWLRWYRQMARFALITFIASSTVANAETITLRWAEVTGFPFARVVEEYFAPLYKELTGVEVVLEIAIAPTTRDKMLLEAISGTNYYHMGYLSPGWHGLFQEHAIDLSPFIEKHAFDISQYPELVWQSHAVDDQRPGEVVAIPHAVNAGFLAYRKDFFEHPDEQAAFRERFGRELRPPTTYQELYEVATFFTRNVGETVAGEVLERPLYGFADSIRHPESAARFFLAFGVYSLGLDGFDENFQPDIDHPILLEGTQFLIKLVRDTFPPQAVNWEFTDHLEFFRDGRLAMALFYNSAIDVVEDPNGRTAGITGYTVLPGWEGNLKGYPQGLHILGGGGVMIFDTPLAEEAFKFLQWLFEENEEEWIRRTETFSRINHFSDPIVLEAKPYYADLLPAFLAALDYQFLRQGIPEYHATVWNPAGDYWTDVFSGDLTPEQAQRRWVETMIREFERAGYR